MAAAGGRTDPGEGPPRGEPTPEDPPPEGESREDEPPADEPPADEPTADEPNATGYRALSRVLDERPRIAFRLLPIGVFAGLFAVSLAVYPVRTQELGGLYFAYFIPPLGKESIVPILVSRGFHPVFAAAAIATMDVIGALLVFTNWDLIVRIPVVGPWLAAFTDKVSEVAARQRVVLAGGWVFLFLFVMFPLQGSGGISGALISRILGIAMERALVIVAVAALVSGLAIALFSEAVVNLVGPEILLVAVATLAGLIGVRTLLSLRRQAE